MFGRHARREMQATATPVHFAKLPTKLPEEIMLSDDKRIVAPTIEAAPSPDPRRVSYHDVEGRQWFILSIAGQQERRCHAGLNDLGYGAYLPAETLWVQHSRTQPRIKREVQRPIFPRYCFLGMSDDASWWPLRERDAWGRNKLGILGVVSNQGRPSPVPVVLLEKLAGKERAGWFDERKRAVLEKGEAELRRPKVEAGEQVRISAGAFATCEGRADEDAAGDKVRIWARVFGQETLMVLPIDDVVNLTRNTANGAGRLHGPLL